MNFLQKLIQSLFGNKPEDETLVKGAAPLVTEEEAYIPYRSEVLNNYLLQRNVNLNDPLDASVKIKKQFRQTTDAAVLKGTVDSRKNITFTAASNVAVINLTDLVLSECSFVIKSEFKDTIVIINVSRRLSLSKNARLTVRGLPPENILINFTGSGSPVLSFSSLLIGTIITAQSMVISSRSSLMGETLRSKPNIIGDGSMVNKTTENFAKLKKQREDELKKGIVPPEAVVIVKDKPSDESAGDEIFEKKKW